MKEHPILFSGPMVRAILGGRKTQTRRVVARGNSFVNGSRANSIAWSRLNFEAPEVFVDAGPSPAGNPGPYLHVPRRDDESVHRVYPTWQPGDRLWVRETCWVHRGSKRFAWYVHQDVFTVDPARDNVRKRPAIHMPRAESRILLEITDVRVQRLQDISEADAIAEGLRWRDALDAWTAGGDSWPTFSDPRRAFAGLWDSINAARGFGWETNCWVWAISFKRVTP